MGQKQRTIDVKSAATVKAAATVAAAAEKEKKAAAEKEKEEKAAEEKAEKEKAEKEKAEKAVAEKEEKEKADYILKITKNYIIDIEKTSAAIKNINSNDDFIKELAVLKLKHENQVTELQKKTEGSNSNSNSNSNKIELNVNKKEVSFL